MMRLRSAMSARGPRGLRKWPSAADRNCRPSRGIGCSGSSSELSVTSGGGMMSSWSWTCNGSERIGPVGSSYHRWLEGPEVRGAGVPPIKGQCAAIDVEPWTAGAWARMPSNLAFSNASNSWTVTESWPGSPSISTTASGAEGWPGRAGSCGGPWSAEHCNEAPSAPSRPGARLYVMRRLLSSAVVSGRSLSRASCSRAWWRAARIWRRREEN